MIRVIIHHPLEWATVDVGFNDFLVQITKWMGVRPALGRETYDSPGVSHDFKLFQGDFFVEITLNPFQNDKQRQFKIWLGYGSENTGLERGSILAGSLGKNVAFFTMIQGLI